MKDSMLWGKLDAETQALYIGWSQHRNFGAQNASNHVLVRVLLELLEEVPNSLDCLRRIECGGKGIFISAKKA